MQLLFLVAAHPAVLLLLATLTEKLKNAQLITLAILVLHILRYTWPADLLLVLVIVK